MRSFTHTGVYVRILHISGLSPDTLRADADADTICAKPVQEWLPTEVWLNKDVRSVVAIFSPLDSKLSSQVWQAQADLSLFQAPTRELFNTYSSPSPSLLSCVCRYINRLSTFTVWRDHKGARLRLHTGAFGIRSRRRVQSVSLIGSYKRSYRTPRTAISTSGTKRSIAILLALLAALLSCLWTVAVRHQTGYSSTLDR